MDTIYDPLNRKGLPWKVYYGDFPQSMLLEHQWRPQNAKRYRRMDEFYRDARRLALCPGRRDGQPAE